MYIISFIFAVANDRIREVCDAAVTGASEAVTLTVTLLGMMCLWCGIMNVLKAVGAIDAVAKLLKPLLRLIFPEACSDGGASGEIAAAISANLLGLGNAATPLALKAMKKMSAKNPRSDEASDDMVTFTVLSTASVNILPTTLIILRRTAGSVNPFEIVVPIWIVSCICAFAAVMFSKALALVFPRRYG